MVCIYICDYDDHHDDDDDDDDHDDDDHDDDITVVYNWLLSHINSY